MAKKPAQDPEKYKGDAKVGDTVRYRSKDGFWHDDFKITGVGFENENKYFNDIRIQRSGGQPKIVSVHNYPATVYVIPPAEEYKDFPPLVAFLAKYKNVAVVRDGFRRYQLICMTCNESLRNVITSVEVADLRYWCDDLDAEKQAAGDGGTGFNEGKPDVDENSTETMCGCGSETAGRMTYDTPQADRYM